MSHARLVASPSLQKFASWGQWVAAISGLLIIGYGVYLAATPDEVIYLLRNALPGVVTLPSPTVLAIAAVVAALPALSFLLCLYQAWRLFGLARCGHLYSVGGQNALGRLGRFAIAAAVLGFATRTVVGLLITSANPPGQKMLTIGIGSGEITGLLVGLLVFLFSTVVREAAALARENASFV